MPIASQLQLRRGTTPQHAVFTGAAGEVTVDTDKKTVVVHDGSTPGGFPLSRESVISTGSSTRRSISDRFADVVNVKDWGVVESADNDDQFADANVTAMRALTDYAATKRGVCIYFPPTAAGNVYFFGASVSPAAAIELPPYTSLRIDGYLKRKQKVSLRFIHVNSFCKIFGNGTIDGNSWLDADRANASLINIGGAVYPSPTNEGPKGFLCHYIWIDGLRWIKSSIFVMNLARVRYLWITNNYVDNTFGAVDATEVPAEYNSGDNCDGIHVYNSSDVWIENNFCAAIDDPIAYTTWPFSLGFEQVCKNININNNICRSSAAQNTAAIGSALGPTLTNVTISIANPAVFTKTSHGLRVGYTVKLTTTGSLPSPLQPNVSYYVVAVPTTSTFQLALTDGGTPFNTTGSSQSGTHNVLTDAGSKQFITSAGVRITTEGVIGFSATTNSDVLSSSVSNIANGIKLRLQPDNANGTLPSPFAPDTDYYVRDYIAGVSFKLSSTLNGSPIVAINSGTGNSRCMPSGIVVENVNVRGNIFQDGFSGVLLGNQSGASFVGFKKVFIENNLFLNIGAGPFPYNPSLSRTIGGGVFVSASEDVNIDQNRFINNGIQVLQIMGNTKNIRFTRNVIDGVDMALNVLPVASNGGQSNAIQIINEPKFGDVTDILIKDNEASELYAGFIHCNKDTFTGGAPGIGASSGIRIIGNRVKTPNKNKTNPNPNTGDVNNYGPRLAVFALDSGSDGSNINIEQFSDNEILNFDATFQTGTVTISNASPAVFTKNNHGLINGRVVRLVTTGTLPTGLTELTNYYVSVIDANTFNVSASITLSPLVDTSSAGSGTHTLMVLTDVTQGSTLAANETEAVASIYEWDSTTLSTTGAIGPFFFKANGLGSFADQAITSISIANPAVITRNNHGLVDNTRVRLTTTGALPAAFNTTTTYYVVNSATNTFQLSLTQGGAGINTTGNTQSGTHSYRSSPFCDFEAFNGVAGTVHVEAFDSLDGIRTAPYNNVPWNGKLMEIEALLYIVSGTVGITNNIATKTFQADSVPQWKKYKFWLRTNTATTVRLQIFASGGAAEFYIGSFVVTTPL